MVLLVAFLMVLSLRVWGSPYMRCGSWLYCCSFCGWSASPSDAARALEAGTSTVGDPFHHLLHAFCPR